jgi:hypothetical protein
MTASRDSKVQVSGFRVQRFKGSKVQGSKVRGFSALVTGLYSLNFSKSASQHDSLPACQLFAMSFYRPATRNQISVP